MLGVDISYSRLTDEKADRLKAAGWEVLFQCLWTARETPDPAIRNLEIALAHGLLVAGYISVNGSQPGAWHVDHARAVVPTHIWDKFVLTPIDVELQGIPNSTIREAVERTVTLGKRRSIYTAEWCWRDNQGNSQDFADCLLWNAAWTGQPLIRPVTYGKWAGVVGQQWSGGYDVEGVYADRNLFVRELLEEETVTLYTKVQQSAIANVLLQLAQPAPLTTAVSLAAWGQAWQAFFDLYNVPEDQRVIPPEPRINQTFAGDFSINVVRGYIRTGDDIRWVW